MTAANEDTFTHSFDSIDIHAVWNVEMEIMDVVHSFCEKHKIVYSLGYGTLLGAVRHKGFIPWDDDIDIIMPRKDYDRFIKEWTLDPPKGFILQDEYSFKDDYPNNFSKIRKDHTCFIQIESEKNVQYHKGIFIDIFPIDRVAPKGIRRQIQYVAFAFNMLYSRRYTDGSKGIMGVIQRMLLGVPSKWYPHMKRLALKIMTTWNDSNGLCVSPCTLPLCKEYLPRNLFDSIVIMKFNDKEYWAIADYDTFLTVRYGDYLQLPPKNERVWKHSPILIDFTHNYEELMGQ